MKSTEPKETKSGQKGLTPEERELVEKYGFMGRGGSIFTMEDEVYGTFWVFRSPDGDEYMSYINTPMLKYCPAVTNCKSPVEAYQRVMEALESLCEKEKAKEKNESGV